MYGTMKTSLHLSCAASHALTSYRSRHDSVSHFSQVGICKYRQEYNQLSRAGLPRSRIVVAHVRLHAGACVDIQDWSMGSTANIGACLVVVCRNRCKYIGKTVSNHDALKVDRGHSASDCFRVMVEDSSGEEGNVSATVALI